MYCCSDLMCAGAIPWRYTWLESWKLSLRRRGNWMSWSKAAHGRFSRCVRTSTVRDILSYNLLMNKFKFHTCYRKITNYGSKGIIHIFCELDWWTWFLGCQFCHCVPPRPHGEYSLTLKITFAYLTYDDVQRIPGLKGQTVIVIKAPAETKLEVPHPEEVDFFFLFIDFFLTFR